MRYILGLILIILMGMTGCLFSYDSKKELKIFDNYYIISIAENHLIFRNPKNEVDILMIPSNVDSIVWNNKFIVAFSINQYYIIEKESQNIFKISNYSELYNFYKKENMLDIGTLKNVSEDLIQ